MNFIRLFLCFVIAAGLLGAISWGIAPPRRVLAQPPGDCGVSISPINGNNHWSFDGDLDSSFTPPEPPLSEVNGPVSYAAGQYNQAVDLEQDSGQHLVNTGSSLSPPLSGLTAAGWVWIEDFNSVDLTTIFIGEYEYGVNNRSWRFGVRSDSGLLRFVTTPDGTYDFSTHAQDGSTPLALNTWYHVAAVFDGSAQEMRIYLNGNLDSTKAVAWSALYDSTAELTIGANYQNGVAVQHFDGLLDEWSVYDRALTTSEIGDLYSCDVSTPTPTPTATVPAPATGQAIENMALCPIWDTGLISAADAGSSKQVDWALTRRPASVSMFLCTDNTGAVCTDNSYGYNTSSTATELGTYITHIDEDGLTFRASSLMAWIYPVGWVDRSDGYVRFIATDFCDFPALATPDSYTNTLPSGKTLYLPIIFSFGQIIIAGVLLAIVGVAILNLAFRVSR